MIELFYGRKEIPLDYEPGIYGWSVFLKEEQVCLLLNSMWSMLVNQPCFQILHYLLALCYYFIIDKIMHEWFDGWTAWHWRMWILNTSWQSIIVSKRLVQSSVFMGLNFMSHLCPAFTFCKKGLRLLSIKVPTYFIVIY